MDNPIFQDVADAPEALSLDEIRAHQQRLRDVVLFGEKVQRLTSNKDFQDVIMDHFLLKEPARLVGFLAADSLSDSQREQVAADLRSIGMFKNMMSRHVQSGASAAAELREVDSAIAEYLEEGGE